MAGLCEGGNETAGSLKAFCMNIFLSDRSIVFSSRRMTTHEKGWFRNECGCLLETRPLTKLKNSGSQRIARTGYRLLPAEKTLHYGAFVAAGEYALYLFLLHNGAQHVAPLTPYQFQRVLTTTDVEFRRVKRYHKRAKTAQPLAFTERPAQLDDDDDDDDDDDGSSDFISTHFLCDVCFNVSL
ncbi:hypothetical protein ANN_11399 [Periplaneta americana]|uniref:Uncharacterized protein n=1 Tax=Periplaneta americana TaxID=6978 RepID=A0ABQ8T6G2_PERAM|nr:hypothetical protein ANN_11399 [Periplaneta americana]